MASAWGDSFGSAWGDSWGVVNRTLVGSSDVVTKTGSGAGFDRHYSRDRGYLPYQFVEPKQKSKARSLVINAKPVEVMAVEVHGYERVKYGRSQVVAKADSVVVPGVNFSLQSVSFRLQPLAMVATIGQNEKIEVPAAFSVNADEAEFVSQLQIVEDDAFVAGMLAGMEVGKRGRR